MTQHTNGPWAFDKYGNSFVVTAKDGMYDIAVVRNIGSEDNEANARVMTASPLLLEACKRLMVCMALAGWENDPAAEYARAAIAAATGTPTGARDE